MHTSSIMSTLAGFCKHPALGQHMRRHLCTMLAFFKELYQLLQTMLEIIIIMIGHRRHSARHGCCMTWRCLLSCSSASSPTASISTALLTSSLKARMRCMTPWEVLRHACYCPRSKIPPLTMVSYSSIKKQYLTSPGHPFVD
jgi:hypothetical protein